MMGRRVGRPGLIGTAARTAVIAGTAQATAGAVAHRQQQKYNQQAYEQQAEYEQQQAAAQPVAAPAEADDMTAKLQQLASLHAQGILSDEEFAAAKSKVLGV